MAASANGFTEPSPSGETTRRSTPRLGIVALLLVTRRNAAPVRLDQITVGMSRLVGA
jgi:hypothetical protein